MAHYFCNHNSTYTYVGPEISKTIVIRRDKKSFVSFESRVNRYFFRDSFVSRYTVSDLERKFEQIQWQLFKVFSDPRQELFDPGVNTRVLALAAPDSP